jgi:deazaflavin-dependent oxidoreductase (nitroreductase family)
MPIWHSNSSGHAIDVARKIIGLTTMPLPGWLARVNRDMTNRVAGPAARWLPGFGVVEHRGRRSGRRYRTPVNLFHSDDRYVIALTYGRDRDWVKNVIAAEGCDIETKGTSIHLARPRIVVDDQRTLVPHAIRPMLNALGVNQFMELTRDPTA